MQALNHALANIPVEAARIHTCWGNGEMPPTRDVELKDIIDIVVTAKPAGLMLMASNGRHAHEWRVFQDTRLPDGKYVIPGVPGRRREIPSGRRSPLLTCRPMPPVRPARSRSVSI